MKGSLSRRSEHGYDVDDVTSATLTYSDGSVFGFDVCYMLPMGFPPPGRASGSRCSDRRERCSSMKTIGSRSCTPSRAIAMRRVGLVDWGHRLGSIDWGQV